MVAAFFAVDTAGFLAVVAFLPGVAGFLAVDAVFFAAVLLVCRAALRAGRVADDEAPDSAVKNTPAATSISNMLKRFIFVYIPRTTDFLAIIV